MGWFEKNLRVYVGVKTWMNRKTWSCNDKDQGLRSYYGAVGKGRGERNEEGVGHMRLTQSELHEQEWVSIQNANEGHGI